MGSRPPLLVASLRFRSIYLDQCFVDVIGRCDGTADRHASNFDGGGKPKKFVRLLPTPSTWRMRSMRIGHARCRPRTANGHSHLSHPAH